MQLVPTNPVRMRGITDIGGAFRTIPSKAGRSTMLSTVYQSRQGERRLTNDSGLYRTAQPNAEAPCTVINGLMACRSPRGTSGSIRINAPHRLPGHHYASDFSQVSFWTSGIVPRTRGLTPRHCSRSGSGSQRFEEVLITGSSGFRGRRWCIAADILRRTFGRSCP
jgi:hypothetical protein